MKIYRPLTVLSLSLLITMLTSGCVTKTKSPMVSAGSYSESLVTRTNTIALSTKRDPSPADVEFNRILVTELKDHGFKLTSFEQSDYILACTIEDEWTENHQQSNLARPTPAAQTTAQLISGVQPTDTASTKVDTSFTSHSQGIRLIIYTNPKTHPDGLQIAWQGCIDPGKSISSQNEQILIRTLLGYFGRDHNGPVNIAE